ncbi:hypothetical protein Tco_0155603 [Tanacetum coccineum]
MIDCLSIVETDKVNHAMETDIVTLVVEIESFDEFDKETGSFDGLQPKQADLSCVYALNELHSHEIHVVSSKHEVDQCGDSWGVDVGVGMVGESCFVNEIPSKVEFFPKVPWQFYD